MSQAAGAKFSSPQGYTPQHLVGRILTSRSALEGERKQVTVLFCDIANSTALAARLGAEAMHSVLNRFFELTLAEVHRYEGTVNQFLGDGFMALFGAPVAHEDHARRAALAGLAIRSAVQATNAQRTLASGASLHLRIGVHTGPVVVGSIGDNLRMDYMAIGDTTNLAARLQQYADPDQILISDTTAKLVRGYVELEMLPPFSIKGRDTPVIAALVTAFGRRRSRLDDDRALSPFVGRERELDILRESLSETRSGRGQVVGVVGEPGAGKSRLIHEFGQLAQASGVQYVEGWCLSFGQAVSYLPLLDLMRGLCGINDTDSAQRIREWRSSGKCRIRRHCVGSASGFS